MAEFRYDDYYKCALYLNQSYANDNEESLAGAIGANALVGAVCPAVGYGWEKTKSVFSKDAAAKYAAEKAKELKELKNIKGGNVWQTYGNAYRYNNIKEFDGSLPKFDKVSKKDLAAMTKKEQAKYAKNQAKSKYYSKARKLLKEAKKLKGKAQAAKLKEFEKALAAVTLTVYEAKYKGNLKPISFIGKTRQVLSKTSGIHAIKTAWKKALANSSKFRTVAKFATKSNAAFAALSVAMDYEKFAETKKLCGSGAIYKEIGKSTAVAAVETLGFLGGMKVGAAIGTAIGGPVGTIVGGAAGAVIGGVLSWGLGKVTKKAMGKSEIEKENEHQARLLTLKARHHERTRKNLMRNSLLKLQNDTIIANASEEELEAAGLSPVDKSKIEQTTKALQNLAADNPELWAQLEEELAAEEAQMTEGATQTA